MKTLLVLVGGLLLAAMPLGAVAQSQSEELTAILGDELRIARQTNEEIVAGIPEDQFAASVIVKIETGKEVSKEDAERAYKYCADSLAKIKTPKMRAKVVKSLMSSPDEKIELWAWKGGSADRYSRARRMSAALSWRFRVLLDFEAERYQRFLEILKASP